MYIAVPHIFCRLGAKNVTGGVAITVLGTQAIL